MKKILSLLVLLTMMLTVSAQQQADSIPSTTPKQKKAASWTISTCYQAQPGFYGSYWKNTFNIAKDKNGYYFVFNMYASDGYYTVNVEETPFVYFKDKEGNIIQLRRDEEPYYTFTLAGFWSGNVYFPMRYVTRFIYDIDDIDEFLTHTFVKYRISLGEGYSDVELSGSYYKKFNKRLKECKEEVDSKYSRKERNINNPLNGF